jgi:DNA-binding SARP family transcriptional activator/WD40 repeat protein/GTPase SAR1 family protein
MEGAAELRFHVLGPLEVRDGNRALPLGGVKQRLVLAGLLAHSNTVVSIDRLVDILWGDAPPEDASSTLAKYVYRLRATCGRANASILVTRSPGYELALTADQLDSSRFVAMVADAQQLLPSDPAQAKTVFDDALGLWRGPAWAEFADLDFLRADVTRLDGLRAMAVDGRADAMLALGRHDELIPELQAVVAAYPLRERPHAQLMLALYFSGRHADALSIYRRFRRYLLDEVGLEPSEDLRNLEQDILQQNVRPGPGQQVSRVAATAHLPTAEFSTSNGKLIGRRNDLDWLEVLFSHATAGGHPAIGIIGGDAGVGKTSLVKAFARRVHAYGVEVVFVRCDEVVGAVGSLLELLGAPASTPVGISKSSDAALSGVDAALAAVGNAPLLVVLDDVDAAADDARLLMEHLAVMRFAAPLFVVATTQKIDQEWISGMGAAVNSRVLHGLSPVEVADLLVSVSGASRPQALVDSICVDTAGIPALVVAIGRRLREVDIADRVDSALARAEAARRGLTGVREDVANGVLARREARRPAALGDRTIADGHLGVCPYKGLAPFAASDAAFFCGRERLVAELVARLAVDRFLGVVGPSGSGKSSVVAAGLLPALTSAALPGSERWPTVIVRPGTDPLHRLATGLAPLTEGSVSVLQQRLEVDPTAVAGVARHAVRDRTEHRGRLVLVIDQFEEVFTACTDDSARDRFIRTLIEAGDPDNAMVVAVVIRSDYYGSCAEYPKLARLLGDSHVLVAAMTDSELRQAVSEPARRAGLSVEDGLPDAICADAAGEPGALPLVSTALLETWVRRSGDTLTIAGYAQAGGVRGAVAHLADGVYEGLDSTGKDTLRHIFLRLVEPQGTTSDIRRRARRNELATNDVERDVLAKLINRRLITVNEDSVEVAHEALLREWPRLRAWLEEDREGRLLHRQLTNAAAAWQADDRDDAGLYRGIRLQAARDWASTHGGDANPIEAEFLAASEAAHERGLRAARRTARRMRSLAAGLAALLVVAVVAGVLLAVQRSETRHQANLARARALQAETSRLATLARTLPNDQRDLALLLGAEAYRIQQSNETAGGLQAAVVQTPPGLERVIRYRSSTFGPHLDRAGRLLAVAGQDGTVGIHELATGRVLQTLIWPRPREFATFSGDAALVAAGGFDGQVVIWDVASGKVSGQPLKVGGSLARAVFDPSDATRMYAVTDTGELQTWDRHDPAHPRQSRPPAYFASGSSLVTVGSPVVTVSGDGRLLAAGDAISTNTALETTEVWDAKSGRHLHSLRGSVGEFASDGVTLPLGTAQDVRLYHAVTGQRAAIVPVPGGLGPLPVLSADGRYVAVTEHGRDVVVYDVLSQQAIGPPLRLHGNGATPLGFLPRGQLVTSGTINAGVWSINRTLPPVAVALPQLSSDRPSRTIFLPGTDEVVTSGVHNELVRHSPRTGQTLGPLLTGTIAYPVAASPDGRQLAGASASTNVTAIWDRPTSRRLGELSGVPAGAMLAWSPTGTLLASAVGPSVQLWDVSKPSQPSLKSSVGVSGITRPDYLFFSSNGRLLVSAEDAVKRITVIDVATHHVSWSKIVTEFALRQVAMSPDGKTIAVNSGDATKGQITLYSATGKARRSVTTQSYGGVAFLHNGDWIVATVGAPEPHAQMYDAATLEPIGVPYPTIAAGVLFGDPIAVNSAGTMFSEAEVNAPLLWNVDPSHWLAVACQIASRNLTKSEWHQYLPSRPYESTCPQLPSGR